MDAKSESETIPNPNLPILLAALPPPPPPPPRRTVPLKPPTTSTTTIPTPLNPNSKNNNSEFAPPKLASSSSSTTTTTSTSTTTYPSSKSAPITPPRTGFFSSLTSSSSSSSNPKSLNSTTSTSKSGNTTPEKRTWKQAGKAWGSKAFEKSIVVSDAVGGRVNGYAEKLGSERFWPVTGDFVEEMHKAARILRAFTVDGLETTVKVDEVTTDGKKASKQRKVLRKIPPAIIQEAQGLIIFTSMRTGFAPFGGAGGTGMVVARLEDGSWSPPSGIMPNNLSTGLMIGVDVYDCILVIRTQKALASFFSHNLTIGSDVGLTAGPFGAGAAMEMSKDKNPVFSYVRSRGLYAGVQLVGQVFVDRIDENALMYHWPGVKAGDILSGKVRMPVEAAVLMDALADAESGAAQAAKGGELDEFVVEGLDDLVLQDGEVLHLPPTPEQADGAYGETQEMDARARLEKEASRKSLSIPPKLPSRAYSDTTSDGGMVAAYEEGIDGPTSGLGFEEMDEASRREWQQHFEEEEHRRLAEMRKSGEGIHEDKHAEDSARRRSGQEVYEDAPEYVARLETTVV